MPLFSQERGRGVRIMLLAAPAIFVASCTGDPDSFRPLAGVIAIPRDFQSVQEGINAAVDGATVVISRGTYRENIVVMGKTITITSENYSSGLTEDIEQTVLDGGGYTVITVGPRSDDTLIQGLTIQNGNDGISVESDVEITGNRIVYNVDGVDYEGGGGTLSGNLISRNRDDGVDLDGPASVQIRENTITDNDDDGIEIRLHSYTGDTIDIVIEDNIICRNNEDGIQLIDYDDASDRTVHIAGNLICDNAMAGLGCMADGNTVEDYSGAPVLEPVFFINNTVSGNDYGLTGGANLAAVNNIFADTALIAVKNLTADSVAACNLFWNNTVDCENTILDPSDSNIFGEDPLLDEDYMLMPGSPAIDAGAASFSWQGEVIIDLPASSYTGEAPDIGCYESP